MTHPVLTRAERRALWHARTMTDRGLDRAAEAEAVMLLVQTLPNGPYSIQRAEEWEESDGFKALFRLYPDGRIEAYRAP
jgi:hypothetical protein